MLTSEQLEQLSTGFVSMRRMGRSLLIPRETYNSFAHEEALAEAAALAREQVRLQAEEIIPASLPLVPGSVQVFDTVDIHATIARLKDGDTERSARHMPVLEAAMRDAGQRCLLDDDVSVVSDRLDQLAIEMPNFTEVIALLKGEISLALAGPAEEFRISPLLMYGAPGIGKTRFARQVATLLAVGFDAISMGATLGGFELSGLASGYSNAKAGRMARLLAEGNSASPVVLLDELDKMAGDERYPSLPILLDLLEPDSAKMFRDEALEIRMDASRILFLGTANDVNRIPDTLASRVRRVEVTAPTAVQLRQIVARLADGYVGKGIDCRTEVLDRLADAELDLRMIQRSLREAAGRALTSGRKFVAARDVILPELPTKMGFL